MYRLSSWDDQRCRGYHLHALRHGKLRAVVELDRVSPVYRRPLLQRIRGDRLPPMHRRNVCPDDRRLNMRKLRSGHHLRRLRQHELHGMLSWIVSTELWRDFLRSMRCGHTQHLRRCGRLPALSSGDDLTSRFDDMSGLLRWRLRSHSWLATV